MPGVWPALPVAGEPGHGAGATTHVNDDDNDVNAQPFEI
jgi:hypothetical protein